VCCTATWTGCLEQSKQEKRTPHFVVEFTRILMYTNVMVSTGYVYLLLRHSRCVKCKGRKIGKVKTQLWCGVVFIKQTTFFGPCTGPSSGLNLCRRRLYSVLLQPNVAHGLSCNEPPLVVKAHCIFSSDASLDMKMAQYKGRNRVSAS
jgi:hypothetical protein